MTHFEIF